MFGRSLLPLVAAGPALPRSYGVWAVRVQTVVLVAAALALAGLAAGPAPAADRPVRIVALGDSLTAGLGLPADGAFPAKLEKALGGKGIAVERSNAGGAGHTATGTRARGRGRWRGWTGRCRMERTRSLSSSAPTTCCAGSIPTSRGRRSQRSCAV